MKIKGPKFIIILFFLGVMLLPNLIFSQDIVTVPDNIDGNPLDALPKFILGDTTATGERTNPDRIYRLERNKLYIVANPLHVTFNLSLIADDDDVNNPTRPPMVVRGYSADGALIGSQFVFDTDSLTIHIKNIFFQGMEMPSAEYPKGRLVGGWSRPLFLNGKSSHVTIDNCVFNGWGVIGTSNAENYSLKFTNNIVRNALDYINPWAGMVIDNAGRDCDTLIFVNNTFFNHASYIILTNRNICNYLLFDHNTIYTSVVNPFFMPYLTNADITNNLIYGYLSMGQLPSEIFGGWYDWDGQISSIASISLVDPNMLAAYGLTESDRKVTYKNNGYAWPQRVKDYWASIDTMEATTWMNERTTNMFNDDTQYPYLNDENNIEEAPGFDASMETTVVDKLLEFTETFRLYGESGVVPVDRSYVPDGEYFNVPWPLPESLTYTNETLLKQAEGNFPVGDLNWFKDKKAEWEVWKLTGVEKVENQGIVPADYSLLQNYPNPFNPTTVISFTIPSASNIKLSVFNVLGQEVKVLVHKQMNKGSYKVEFDASGLNSGIYFYKLQSGNYSATRKMTFLK